MNIKQAQELTGISRENIRFYEREGLIHPDRNPENDYRDYGPEDVRRLKIIRMLRMLDMPLEDVGKVLGGKITLPEAAECQRQRLANQVESLEKAIRLCQEMTAWENLEGMDVDRVLANMDSSGKNTFYSRWMEDYRQAAAWEHRRVFTFTPEGAVTTPREFTDVLLAFARETGQDLVVTREGMYPEFTLNGIAYTAWRDYHSVCRCPVATVHCEMMDSESGAPDLPPRRRRFLRLLITALPGIGAFFLFAAYWIPKIQGWQDIYLIFLVGFLCAFGSYRFWRFHFNDQTPK